MKEQEQRERCFRDSVPTDRPRRRMYPVLRPKAAGEVRAIITSQFVLLAETHYLDQVSYQCVGLAGDCPFCREGTAPRLKGYLCGVDVYSGKACVIELTDNAVRENTAIRERKVSLRGKICVLRRPGQNRNSPVFCALETCYQKSLLDTLPQPFNLEQALSAMWEVPVQGTLFGRDRKTARASGANDEGRAFADARKHYAQGE